LVALLLDYLLILGWLSLVAVWSAATWAITGSSPAMFTASLTSAQISTAAVTVLPVGLHLWAGEAGRKQATWGKRRTGLTVTRLDGGRPTRWQIAVRTVVKLLPWQLAHMSVLLVVEQTVRRDLAEPTPWVVAGLVTAQVLAGVWVVWTLLAPQRRGPHDLAAKTAVVRRSAAPSPP
jgi:uncharacterized RDD family membrane protein YckC